MRRVRAEPLYAVDTGKYLGHLLQYNSHFVSRRFPGLRSYNSGSWVTPEQLEHWEVEWCAAREADTRRNKWYRRLWRLLRNER